MQHGAAFVLHEHVNAPLLLAGLSRTKHTVSTKQSATTKIMSVVFSIIHVLNNQ